MKKIFSSLMACAFAAAAHAQQIDQAAAMKAWQAYMTPGDMHKMIAKSNGKWITETTMWMDPSAQPAKSTGTCTNTMILGGRYQQSTFKGSFMEAPFEGQSLLAYDNAKRMFINTWVDNMGSGIMMLEGKWDDATKSISFSGKCIDPMTGKEMPVREVFTIIDDNHQRMEMYAPDPSGKEFKTMETTFTRAAKKS